MTSNLTVVVEVPESGPDVLNCEGDDQMVCKGNKHLKERRKNDNNVQLELASTSYTSVPCR